MPSTGPSARSGRATALAPDTVNSRNQYPARDPRGNPLENRLSPPTTCAAGTLRNTAEARAAPVAVSVADAITVKEPPAAGVTSTVKVTSSAVDRAWPEKVWDEAGSTASPNCRASLRCSRERDVPVGFIAAHHTAAGAGRGLDQGPGLIRRGGRGTEDHRGEAGTRCQGAGSYPENRGPTQVRVPARSRVTLPVAAAG